MAGISSSAALAAPPSPMPGPPVAVGYGGESAAADDDNDNDNNNFSPLLDLLERCPDLFAQKVLVHLDPIDHTFLAQAGSACRAAVAASDLPRAGSRSDVLGRSVLVVTHRLAEIVGSVERLAWAKASGCPWIARTCALVARAGRLEVLQWAQAQSCPWDTLTLAHAALHGHLEVLQWARAHGCPVGASTCITPLGAGTWRCCSGRGSTTAPGTRAHVSTPLLVDTWRCCGGRGRTAARGASGVVKSIPRTTRRLWHGCGRNHRTTHAHHTNTDDTGSTTSDDALASGHHDVERWEQDHGPNALTCCTLVVQRSAHRLRMFAHHDPWIYRYGLSDFRAIHM